MKDTELLDGLRQWAQSLEVSDSIASLKLAEVGKRLAMSIASDFEYISDKIKSSQAIEAEK